MNTITVSFGSDPPLLSADYAALKGIPDGYLIKSEAEFWDILGGHSRHQIEKLNLLIAAEKQVN